MGSHRRGDLSRGERIERWEVRLRDANEQWVAAHMTPEQDAGSVLDCFKPAVQQELEMLDVECREQPSN
jgi:hypothetical protein